MSQMVEGNSGEIVYRSGERKGTVQDDTTALNLSEAE